MYIDSSTNDDFFIEKLSLIFFIKLCIKVIKASSSLSSILKVKGWRFKPRFKTSTIKMVRKSYESSKLYPIRDTLQVHLSNSNQAFRIWWFHKRVPVHRHFPVVIVVLEIFEHLLHGVFASHELLFGPVPRVARVELCDFDVDLVTPDTATHACLQATHLGR